MFNPTSSMNSFKSSPLVSYLWNSFKMFSQWMCTRNVKENSKRPWHLITSKAFFKYMYKVHLIQPIINLFLYVVLFVLGWWYCLYSLLSFIVFHMQHKISFLGNVVVKVYYEDFPKGGECFFIKLKEHMEKAMDQVRKDHYSAFCKHLLVCDLVFGQNFLKEIHLFIIIWISN